MTAIKSIGFVAGWIITAYIGFWAMALYGVTMGIVAWNGRMNPDDYEFYSEKEKYDFIHDTFFDHMYRCPNCGEAYADDDDALNCCYEDCYEQEKGFIIEERADERLRREKGD